MLGGIAMVFRPALPAAAHGARFIFLMKGLPPVKVAKFGGTSLADAGQIRKICEIILSDSDRKIVVVSAPGKRRRADIKVTDLLIACAKARLEKGSAEAELQAVLDRYAEIQAELGLPDSVLREIKEDLRMRLEGDASHAERFMDTMKASGEDNAARLTAQALRSLGADAHYLNPKDAGLLLSDEFGNAQVLPESYANLKAALEKAPGITVFPGFFGYTRKGDVATFPRGGSDITGAILAAAVEADLYENFTDVDSVFAALHIKPRKLIKVADSFTDFAEPLLHNSGIPSYDAILPIRPFYKEGEQGKKPQKAEKPECNVKKSKKGVPIVVCGILALIILLIPLLLILGVGFVVNRIKYGKYIKENS